MIEPRALFAALFEAAVAAADPERILGQFLPEKPTGRTVVVGAGKGASQMARALERAWDGPLEGVVVTRYGYAVACERIEVIEAAHPVPDAAGLAGAERLLRAVRGLTRDDLVIALISGGGSALLPMPAEGLTLADEIAVNRALLVSGAPIAVMNRIRKRISRIKGGRLAAAAHPARVISLIVSDIPGDDPELVSSGPTVPGTANAGGVSDDVFRFTKHYGIVLPAAVGAFIASTQDDAPDRFDPIFAENEVRVIASARQSLEAAAEAALSFGVEAVILSDAIEGEACEVGKVHAAVAREIALRDRPFRKPALLLSGGETTVTVGGSSGKGGRNCEFLLALALAVEGSSRIHGFAADTDGIDGSQDNAGAFFDPLSVIRMRAKGLDPKALLAGHDAWTAFDASGDLFVPGPTGTNINDLRAMWIT